MNTPDWDVIRAEVPELAIGQVTPLDEGWGSTVWLAGEDLVFKVPKRAEVSAEVAREIEVLSVVAPRVPLKVPRPVLWRGRSAGWPHGVGVFGLVPGEPLEAESMTPRQRANVAEELAGFLRVLHRTTLDERLVSILPRSDGREELAEILARAEVEIVPRLSGQQAAILRAEAHRYLDRRGNFDHTPVLIHADLSAEHLRWVDGRLHGVLDFGDAALGDPDHDFAGLYEDLGADVVIDCAIQYGHLDPPALVDKLWRRSVFGYLEDLMTAPELGENEDAAWALSALEEWLRRAA